MRDVDRRPRGDGSGTPAQVSDPAPILNEQDLIGVWMSVGRDDGPGRQNFISHDEIGRAAVEAVHLNEERSVDERCASDRSAHAVFALIDREYQARSFLGYERRAQRRGGRWRRRARIGRGEQGSAGERGVLVGDVHEDLSLSRVRLLA
jgi:hypothetical protein